MAFFFFITQAITLSQVYDSWAYPDLAPSIKSNGTAVQFIPFGATISKLLNHVNYVTVWAYLPCIYSHARWYRRRFRSLLLCLLSQCRPQLFPFVCCFEQRVIDFEERKSNLSFRAEPNTLVPTEWTEIEWGWVLTSVFPFPHRFYFD